ncbi:hypothetical protein D046_6982, partial [Vibrio parahaemolyticus V-223/04]
MAELVDAPDLGSGAA